MFIYLFKKLSPFQTRPTFKSQSLILLAFMLVSSFSNATTPDDKAPLKPATANPFFNTPKNRLQNPNSALVELAFKFGKNPSAEKYQEVYDEYCQKGRDGNANALFALGWMHETGKGGPVDKAVAKSYYLMSADRNNQLAINALAKLAETTKQAFPMCMLPDPNTYVVEREESHTQLIATLQAEHNAKLEAEELARQAVLAEKAANAARAERLFKRQRKIYRMVKRVARKYRVDPKLVMSFIAIESGFDTYATSVKNAQGLMQLMPFTAERFGIRDSYNPNENIKGGVRYLRWLLAYYQGNVELVAAAYNAGERAVDRYRGVPPYKETQNYVKKIAKLYGKETHPYRKRYVKPSPIAQFFNRHLM